MKEHRLRSKFKSLRFAFALLVLLALVGCRPAEGRILEATYTPTLQPTASPTPDRLAIPVMPESPTQVDVGRNLYYYHCMPCHGDRGQGLTDEWREVWVPDHQNCWARGCHAGRSEEEAFFIPRFVPPVSGSSQALESFQTNESLFTYLRQAHPPQRPGALSDAECWALTAFLLYENDRLPPVDATTAVMLGLPLVMLLVLWVGKRRPGLAS